MSENERTKICLKTFEQIQLVARTCMFEDNRTEQNKDFGVTKIRILKPYIIHTLLNYTFFQMKYYSCLRLPEQYNKLLNEHWDTSEDSADEFDPNGKIQFDLRT